MENSNTTKTRCVELACEKEGDGVVRTRYKVGYAEAIVTSSFTGKENLSDLLYGIIMRQKSEKQV